jgi:signal transduction histidine kinase
VALDTDLMWPRLFKSTAFRTAALAAGLFALAGTLLLALLYYELTQEMLRPIRVEIEQQSGDLLKEWKRNGGKNYDAGFEAIISESVDGNASLRHEIVYAVIDKGGHLLSGDKQISLAFIGWREWTPGGAEQSGDADQADAFPILALGAKIDDVTIITGRKLLGVSEAQEVFIRVLSIGLGVICLLALGLGWVMSRTSLRRLDDMVLATKRFADGDLSTRLPIIGKGDDIEQLAENVNRMLGQTTDLMGAMKRMSGSLAHEMKSPLTRLRQKLEDMTGKAWPTREGLLDAVGEMDQVIALFNGLLRITQIEAGERRGKFETVDLGALVREVVGLHQPVAEERQQNLSFLIEPETNIAGDSMLLKQLISNLIDNAVKHTPRGSLIAVKAFRDVDGVHLTVGDNGQGLSEVERGEVLKPFHRPQRSHEVPGTGLGLATVKAISEVHDAGISLHDNAPGLVVSVAFPRVLTS